MNKYFSINDSGFSIRCKLYCNDPRATRHVVLFGHGFGGHKDNKAAERFAERLLAKKKDWAVLCFDWPCHGQDARRKLVLAECLGYLDRVVRYCGKTLRAESVSMYATSFGGFVTLVYLREFGNPFRRIALRCPALPMHASITSTIMTEQNRLDLAKGKETLVGFDRKVRVSPAFMKELEAADVLPCDFSAEADKILILHGTKDEIIPMEPVRDFAERNGIPFLPVEGADHRFMDPNKMDSAIHEIISFLIA